MQISRTLNDVLFAFLSNIYPSVHKITAFYLSPLKKPTETCWYSPKPLGKNKLSMAVSKMCKACGIQGYNSLRATAATWLYSSGVDEQLVMERTGHRSIGGIWSYKRTTTDQMEAV